MDFKNSRMIGDDCIRIPFNCDQGFEEYYLVYVGKSPFEHERHLDKVVCSRGPLTTEEHEKCKKTPKDICWKDQEGWPVGSSMKDSEPEQLVSKVRKSKKK